MSESTEPGPIEYRRIVAGDVPAFARALDAVIAERRWLGSTRPCVVGELVEFVENVERTGAPQLLAFERDRVVGWCDVAPGADEARTHVGRLGMGVAADARRRGIGTNLLVVCLAQAAERGLDKVELEVYHDNAGAIALYRRHGFELEGRRVQARKLDGRYQDLLQMALFVDGRVPRPS